MGLIKNIILVAFVACVLSVDGKKQKATTDAPAEGVSTTTTTGYDPDAKMVEEEPVGNGKGNGKGKGKGGGGPQGEANQEAEEEGKKGAKGGKGAKSELSSRATGTATKYESAAIAAGCVVLVAGLSLFAVRRHKSRAQYINGVPGGDINIVESHGRLDDETTPLVNSNAVLA